MSSLRLRQIPFEWCLAKFRSSRVARGLISRRLRTVIWSNRAMAGAGMNDGDLVVSWRSRPVLPRLRCGRPVWISTAI